MHHYIPGISYILSHLIIVTTILQSGFIPITQMRGKNRSSYSDGEG